MLAQADVVRVEADLPDPAMHRLEPAVEFGRAVIRADEVLDLHLLELDVAEDEVAGRDLVAERFADLADAERQLDPRRGEDVLVLDEHGLGRLRSQVDLGAALLTGPIVVRNIMLNWRASVRVRLPQTGQGRFASRRICRHLLWRLALGVDAELLLDQMVGAESALAGLAIDQRIVEVDDVTRRLPDRAGASGCRHRARPCRAAGGRRSATRAA